jgi:hypothetical protein
MVTTQTFVVLAAVLATIVGFYFLNEHTFRRFQYRFFSWKSLLTISVASGFVLAGLALYARVDQLSGYLSMGVAGAIVSWLVFVSIRRTNLIYGLAGSVLQLVVLGQLGWAVLVMGILAVPVLVALLWTVTRVVTPVYVINRDKR